MGILRYLSQELKDIWSKVITRTGLAISLSAILFIIFRICGLANFWYSIPIAMLSTILTGIIFQAPGFKKFLQEAASEVIQDKKYLEKLNREHLEKMLTKIHQVYYGLPVELEKGSLYDFVKENILHYLGEAYEENVAIEYDLHKKEEHVEIKLNKQFTVTALSEKPVEGDRDISLRVSPIPGRDEGFHFPFDEFLLKVNGAEVGFPKDSKKVINDGDALKFLYKQKYRVSKASPLIIEYKIVGNERKDEKLIHQTFLLPVKGFKFRVTAHDFGDCVFSYHFSGPVEPKPEMVRKDERKFDLNYDGWMIPGNSITVYFSPRNP